MATEFEKNPHVGNVNRLLSCLEDQNRAVRRKSLQELLHYFKDTSIRHDDVEIIDVIKSVLKVLFDSSEKCREMAITLSSELLRVARDGETHLPFVMPVFVARLGQGEITEPSEELRLELVKLIKEMLDSYGTKMTPYIGDMMLVLQRTTVDPYPDVKKISAECIIKLAETCPQVFYHQGECLVKPLLQGICHQHSKVRMTCLKSLGSVIQHVQNSALDGALPVLAKKTYDGNVEVRKCLINVTGNWLMSLVDRYSYQWKLIPLLLCCLSDDVEELRKSTWEIWGQVGKKFEQENEEDLKDQMDFPEAVSLPNDLADFGRPGLGCRVIVQRNFHKILPPLLKDLCDWSLKSRLKASQLLFHLLYHLEEHITQSLQLLLGGLYGGCADEELEIVHNSTKCANMVGFYVPVEIWSDLVLSAVRTSSGCGKQGGSVESSVAVGPNHCTGCLRCFSGLIQGASGERLFTCLRSIVKCLGEQELVQTNHVPVLKGVLCCVRNILQKKLPNDHENVKDLFLILLRLSSVEMENHWQKQVQDALLELCMCAGHRDTSELYREYGKEILQPMIDKCDLWTPATPDCLVFTSFLKHGGTAAVSFCGEIVPVFCSALNPDNNVDLHLHFIVLLIEFLWSVKEADKANFHQHAMSIVKDIVIPNTVWKAGRTASALRTSMMACLQTLLDHSLLPVSSLEVLMDALLPQVLSCLDDSNESTRKTSCQVLRYLFPIMSIDKLHTIYCDLLKRLDDSVEDIRLSMTETLLAFFRSLPQQYDASLYKAHCEALFSSLLIHLDDPSEKIQESVLAVLKEASRLDRELLKEHVESVCSKHRSQKYCNELLHHISSLKE